MLKTDRLQIVSLEEKHLEPLRMMRNDPSTWQWLTDTTFISKKQQEVWFEKLSQDKSKLYLAIELKDAVAEYIYFSVSGTGSFPTKTYMPSDNNFVGLIRSDEWDRVNKSVRIGIDITMDYRGKGYATEAFSAFINYLFKEQNMNRAWLLVAEKNSVAIKLYEKLGFIKEGVQKQSLFRDGAYIDYISMSILKQDWEKQLKNKRKYGKR